jgi:type I restriction enzyme, R subunit
MSNFSFLDAEWPALADEAAKAERLAYADPRTACFYARRTLEFTVGWLYKHDSVLRLPAVNIAMVAARLPLLQEIQTNSGTM